MSAYLLAFIAPVALFPLRKKSRTAYVMLLAGAWAMFAGLRYEIGGSDYFAYRDFYLSLSGFKGIGASGWEPLFRFLCGLSSYLGLDYHGFLTLVALLGILPAVHVIESRMGESPIGLFAYGIEFMLYGSFVILRQSIAIGLAFMLLDAVLDKKPIKALLFCLAAAGFHYSALAMLLLLPFSWTITGRAKTALYLAAAIGGACFILLVFSGRQRLGFTLGDRLFHYMGGGFAERINPLNFLELVLLALLLRRYAGKSEGPIGGAFMLTIVFMNFGLISSIFVRVASYFKVAVPLFLSTAVRGEPEGRLERRFGTAWIHLAIFAYYYAKIARWLLVNAGGLGGFLPYRTIL